MSYYKYFYRGSHKDDNPAYEVDLWCNQQFGVQPERWAVDLQGYWFKEEADYNWFVLRWGHEVLE